MGPRLRSPDLAEMRYRSTCGMGGAVYPRTVPLTIVKKRFR